MAETWYVMEDGSVGDPRDISYNADGKLAHKDGRMVAYASHGPRTRGIDPDEERSKRGKSKSDSTPKSTDTKDIRASAADKAEEPKRAYKTRESKAE